MKMRISAMGRVFFYMMLFLCFLSCFLCIIFWLFDEKFNPKLFDGETFFVLSFLLKIHDIKLIYKQNALNILGKNFITLLYYTLIFFSIPHKNTIEFHLTNYITSLSSLWYVDESLLIPEWKYPNIFYKHIIKLWALIFLFKMSINKF